MKADDTWCVSKHTVGAAALHDGMTGCTHRHHTPNPADITSSADYNQVLVTLLIMNFSHDNAVNFDFVRWVSVLTAARDCLPRYCSTSTASPAIISTVSRVSPTTTAGNTQMDTYVGMGLYGRSQTSP